MADKVERTMSDYAWLCIKRAHVQRSLIGMSASWEVANATQIARSGAATTGTLTALVADQIGGSARGYLADLSRHERFGHHWRPRHDSECGLDIYAGHRVLGIRAHAA